MKFESTQWSPVSRASDALEVHLLGLVDFESALFLQERFVYEISGRQDRFGALLVCEHPPLLTIGREGSRADVRCESADLVSRQLEIRWINRGGGCIVHGPGQLAVYPIVPLDRLGFGLQQYRQCLEAAVVQTCQDLRIETNVSQSYPGISCRGGQFSTLGIAVKSWVAYHGLFVNVNPRLDLMRLAKPSQVEHRLTSLEAQRARTISMHSVRSRIIQHLAELLCYDQFHIHTGHPLLRRTRTKVYDYA